MAPALLSSSRFSSVTQIRRRTRKNITFVTFHDFVYEVYLPHVHHYKRSDSVDERNSRLHLLPPFGNHLLHEITRDDVEQWLHGLAIRFAPATCNRILTTLSKLP